MKQYPRVALALWLLALAGAAWQISNVRINTDLAAFLPPSADRTQQLLLDQMRDGVASRIMLMAIEGSDGDRLALTSDALVARLTASGKFIWVNNGNPAFVQAEREYLMHNRYLLSPTVEATRFTLPGLRAALEDALQLATSAAGVTARATIPVDPTSEFRSTLSALGGSGPQRRNGVWLSADGSRALLLAETRAAGFDAALQQQAVDAARSAYAAIDDSGSGRLLLSGPGVFAAESRAVIRDDAWRLSAAAGTIVMLILVRVHRSARRVALCMLPVVTGLAVGAAAVGFAFGSIHGITLGFGVTLIGEAVDYPTYLFLNARRGETVPNELARIWPTLRLAVLTSMVGGLTMLASGFAGLSQLGLLSVTGVLAAGLVTRWVLPPMAGSSRAAEAPAILVRLAALPRQRICRVAAFAGCALAVAIIVARHDRVWSDDLTDLSPVSAQSRAIDSSLRKELAAPDVRHLVVAFGTTREQALQHSEDVADRLRAMVAQGQLGGFEHAAGYFPSRAVQLRRQAVLPDAAVLAKSLEEAASGLPFRDGLFAPFLRDVAEARARAPLELADLGDTAITARVRSLLFETDDRWVALIALRGIHDAGDLAAVADGIEHGDVEVLDLKDISHRMVNDYRNEALKFTAIGTVAIIVVLLAGLHGASDAVRVVAPVLLAVLIAVAGLLVAGEKLTLFHVVALLLVIGIGLNYALFFNRRDTDQPTRRRTLMAIAVCATTTITAFGVLALSSTPVLHAVGLTVSLGAIASLVLSAALGPKHD